MNETKIEIKELELIEKGEALSLQKKFMPYFEIAEKLKVEANKIKIMSIDQVDDMQTARKMRLEIKTVRVNTEKLRKELKEESLLKGKAIDGMANIIKYLIEPTENYLKSQEEFAINLEKERLEKIKYERSGALLKYVEDISLYRLDDMTENQFEILLKNAEIAFNAKIEAEKKAEEERLEREKAEKIEQERIRKENENLKLERELQEKKEKELQERLKKAEFENETKERELQEKIRQSEMERIRIEKAEIERQKEEIAARELQEKIAMDNEEKEKLKGESEKFLDYCKNIESVFLPNVQSQKGITINQSIKKTIAELIDNIKKSIEK